MLKDKGHQVIWDDGNAQLKTYDQWFEDLVARKPDVVVFESTTPVMKFYWRTVNHLKSKAARHDDRDDWLSFLCACPSRRWRIRRQMLC